MIYITRLAYEKIQAYIKHAEGEISGLGRATFDQKLQRLTVTDFFIWRQTATGGSTEVIDHNATFGLASELEAAGVPMEELCVWWHSHANMGSFFSSTDEGTIKEWVSNRFLCAIVGNKKGEYKAKIAIKSPIPCDLNDVKIEIEPETVDEDMVLAAQILALADRPTLTAINAEVKRRSELDTAIAAEVKDKVEAVVYEAHEGGKSFGFEGIPDGQTKKDTQGFWWQYTGGLWQLAKLGSKGKKNEKLLIKKNLKPSFTDLDTPSVRDYDQVDRENPDQYAAWDLDYLQACGCEDCEDEMTRTNDGLDDVPHFDYSSHTYDHASGVYLPLYEDASAPVDQEIIEAKRAGINLTAKSKQLHA